MDNLSVSKDYLYNIVKKMYSFINASPMKKSPRTEVIGIIIGFKAIHLYHKTRLFDLGIGPDPHYNKIFLKL